MTPALHQLPDEGVAKTLKERAQIQRDHGKLEDWALDHKMKLTQDKSEVLHLEKKKQMHRNRMGENRLYC